MSEKLINPMAFCSEDEKRPNLMKPMFYENLVWATDGNLCLICPPEKTINTHLIKEITPGHIKLIEEVKRQSVGENASIQIDLSKIEFIFQTFTHEIIKCDECNGEGECECDECGSNYKCKKCAGEGEVKGRKYDTPLIVINGNSRVLIKDGNLFPGVYYRARLLYKLKQEIGPIWEIIKFEATRANLFIHDDIKMVVMPIYRPNTQEDHDTVIIYKPESVGFNA